MGYVDTWTDSTYIRTYVHMYVCNQIDSMIWIQTIALLTAQFVKVICQMYLSFTVALQNKQVARGTNQKTSKIEIWH